MMQKSQIMDYSLHDFEEAFLFSVRFVLSNRFFGLNTIIQDTPIMNMKRNKNVQKSPIYVCCLNMINLSS